MHFLCKISLTWNRLCQKYLFPYDKWLTLCLWQQFKKVVDIWFMALAAVCGTQAHEQEMSWPSKWEFGPPQHNPHSSQACWTIVPVLRDKRQQIMGFRGKYLCLLTIKFTFIFQAHFYLFNIVMFNINVDYSLNLFNICLCVR